VPDTPTETPTETRADRRGGNPPGYRDPIGQAVDWQRRLNSARDTDPKLCVPLSQGARAWLEVERLKREIRMQPKPRPVDVSDSRRKVKVVPRPEEGE